MYPYKDYLWLHYINIIIVYKDQLKTTLKFTELELKSFEIHAQGRTNWQYFITIGTKILKSSEENRK